MPRAAAIVVPAIARLYGMAVEHRPAGREHTVQGFNVDLWRTYLYKPECVFLSLPALALKGGQNYTKTSIGRSHSEKRC